MSLGLIIARPGDAIASASEHRASRCESPHLAEGVLSGEGVAVLSTAATSRVELSDCDWKMEFLILCN